MKCHIRHHQPKHKTVSHNHQFEQESSLSWQAITNKLINLNMNCHSNEDHLYTIHCFLYSDIKVHMESAIYTSNSTRAFTITSYYKHAFCKTAPYSRHWNWQISKDSINRIISELCGCKKFIKNIRNFNEFIIKLPQTIDQDAQVSERKLKIAVMLFKDQF